MQLGADSLDLLGIAESIHAAMSISVTSMTLLEHRSFRDLSQHLSADALEPAGASQ